MSEKKIEVITEV